MAIAALLAAGCGGAPRDDAPAPVPVAALAPRVPDRADAPDIPVARSAPAGERRITRTIETDPDGDGIADRRLIITEVYAADGALLQEIRAEDFEADGIVDARRVTTFDDISH